MAPNYCYPAKVLRVIDGDTYDVEIDVGFRLFVRVPLRLAHVNTPERFTLEGQNAKNYMTSLFGHLPRDIVVQTYKPVEKYGRYLAEVYLTTPHEVITLSEYLITNGIGKPYEGRGR